MHNVLHPLLFQSPHIDGGVEKKNLSNYTTEASIAKWLTGYYGNQLPPLQLLIPQSLCHPIFSLK